MRASIARATLMLLLLTTPHLADAQNVDWRHYGGDPGNTHWSELKQISTANVQKLKAAWVLQLGTLRAQESTPLVVGDTLYVTSSFGPKHVFAVDGRTGELRWRHDAEIAADVDPYGCCDVNSRGLAYANGKLFVGLLDGRLRALDARTGKDLWTSVVVDYKQGSVITSPPVVAKNKVIIGYGGGEYGVRGSLSGVRHGHGRRGMADLAGSRPRRAGQRDLEGRLLEDRRGGRLGPRLLRSHPESRVLWHQQPWPVERRCARA